MSITNDNINPNGVSMDPQQIQSKTIDLLRFPLAIMVIFIHLNPKTVSLVDADFALLSGRGLFNGLQILFSHVLTHIAVPAFFFISGFLFFINIQEWSWKTYGHKMRNRLKSLIIPYFLWNALPFILMILGAVIHVEEWTAVQKILRGFDWHIFYDFRVWGTDRVNWLGGHLKSTGPYDLPLWFLRDLIVGTTLTPVIYLLVSRLKLFFVSLLLLAYITKVWILLPGFSITMFFFFSLGAYFALNKINIVQFVTKYKYWFVLPAMVLMVVCVVFDGGNTPIGQIFYPFFVCTGVFTAFYFASLLVSKYQLRSSKYLVSSCFFIYAFHVLYLHNIGSPLSRVLKALHHLIPGTSLAENVVCYLFSPFLTALLCILVLFLFRKILPRTTLLFSGNK